MVKEIGTRLPDIRPGSFKCYYEVTEALESEQRRDGVYTEGTECFSLTPGGPLVCMAVASFPAHTKNGEAPGTHCLCMR